jgi:hypothetical protein
MSHLHKLRIGGFDRAGGRRQLARLPKSPLAIRVSRQRSAEGFGQIGIMINIGGSLLAAACDWLGRARRAGPRVQGCQSCEASSWLARMLILQKIIYFYGVSGDHVETDHGWKSIVSGLMAVGLKKRRTGGESNRLGVMNEASQTLPFRVRQTAGEVAQVALVKVP